MTTIAWDGKTLAADGAMWFNEILYRTKKVQRITLANGETVLFAGMGGSFYIEAVENWLKTGTEKPDYKDFGEDKPDALLGVMITADKTIKLIAINLHSILLPDEKIIALGAGGPVALGAMEAGATAPEALAIALRRSDGARIAVDTVSFEDGSV